MNRTQRIARICFATGVMSVGVLVLVYGYQVLLFLPTPPAWAAWLEPVGVASGVLMLATGAGLLFERTAPLATRVLLPFLALWTLTRVQAPIVDPIREISWFAIGEVGVLAAGALVLFARIEGARSKLHAFAAEHGPAVARILVGYSAVTFGLSHFFEFHARTVSLVPHWLPYPTLWADVMGGAQVAAGLGAAFAVYPRLSVAAEAAMMTAFALLVWVPAVIVKPGLPSNWVEFLVTWALAGAYWVVAEGMAEVGPRP
ncbi:MAG: DoxX family protein [Gemmatimonadota bacterium]|nr:DoxX family protein [Gemmatimonadota bacterium]